MPTFWALIYEFKKNLIWRQIVWILQMHTTGTNVQKLVKVTYDAENKKKRLEMVLPVYGCLKAKSSATADDEFEEEDNNFLAFDKSACRHASSRQWPRYS